MATVSRGKANQILADSSHADALLGSMLPRSLVHVQGTDYGSDVFDQDTDEEEEAKSASGEHNEDEDDDDEYARAMSAPVSAPSA
jgi:hypothetical protein